MRSFLCSHCFQILWLRIIYLKCSRRPITSKLTIPSSSFLWPISVHFRDVGLFVPNEKLWFQCGLFEFFLGQSFGAFLSPGLTLEHEGDSNDYVGKVIMYLKYLLLMFLKNALNDVVHVIRVLEVFFFRLCLMLRMNVRLIKLTLIRSLGFSWRQDNSISKQ